MLMIPMVVERGFDFLWGHGKEIAMQQDYLKLLQQAVGPLGFVHGDPP